MAKGGIMTKVILSAALLVAALGLAGCEMTQAQKDAAAFQKLCSQHHELAECQTQQ